MSLPLRIALSTLSRPERYAFGADPSQVADLHIPRRGSGPHPVAVVLHGGHWRTGYGKLVCRPIAVDLAVHGWAAWNVEYRRLGTGRGSGGGWPMTFQDVGLGIDHLATLADPRLDLARVVLVGHSAGGQLALWAAGRSTLPTGAVGADPLVPATGAVALSPVTDLARAGVPARRLVGGTPDEVPERWRQVDPLRCVPPPVAALVVHPRLDRTIAVELSRAYVGACRAAGGDVQIVEPPEEGHRDPIDPSSASWRAAVAWLRDGGRCRSL